MKKNQRKDPGISGSITVFLALTFIFIFALVGTMVEVARVKICGSDDVRQLEQATKNLMGEYSEPFYQRYKLFALEDTGVPFDQAIAAYLGMEERSQTDVYRGALTKLRVWNKNYCGDEDGEALREEIVTWMRRKVVKDEWDKIRNKTEQVSKEMSQASVIETKAKQVKKEADEGKKLMKLMRLIDGVYPGKSGLKAETYFSKKFYQGKNQKETFGITKEYVWEAMKKKGVNVDKVFDKLEKTGNGRTQFIHQLTEVHKKTLEAIACAKGFRDPFVPVLESNDKIIKSTMTSLKRVKGGKVSSRIMKNLREKWALYDTTGIVFTYGDQGSGKTRANPMDSCQNILSGGLCSLVLKNPQKVSKKEITKADKYLEAANGRKTEETDSAQNFLKTEEVDFQTDVYKAVKTGEEHIMFREYLSRYFSFFGEEGTKEEPHQLDYELEYILNGKNTDQKNLENTLLRIMWLRTAANAVTIFQNAEYREEAYTAALAVAGFTGIEPLVRFLQIVFLVLWGMCDAIVDVAGIVQNKEVPLIKDKPWIKFWDVLLMNRTFVQKKVSQMTERTKKGLSYETYLKMFLQWESNRKATYRMMDVMEENIRKGGIANFQLGTCVLKFQTEATFEHPGILFSLPSLQEILNRNLNFYHLTARYKAAYVEGSQ